MPIARRALLRSTLSATLGTALAAPALHSARAAEARVLKISHQFPGGTIDEGDFRDRLVRIFARDVEAETHGELSFQVYPGASLMKTVAQFSALRRGALDLSIYPLAYAGGEVPEVNITLMPMLVTSYEQGAAWKSAPIGRELDALLDRRGVKLLTWVWQAGGIASRNAPVVTPEDVRGQKIRGGSREFDLFLKSAGGIISSVPSNEAYAAMQTGSLDAVVTSSTSLTSFRIYEIAKHVTTPQAGSIWFMFTPLLMSKAIFDSLTPDQQAAILRVGARLEPFAVEGSRRDDAALAEVFSRAGVTVHQEDAAALSAWKPIAQASAWADFAARNAACADLMRAAQAVG
jgi:TRAP-type C4-dicarboxylate transport system substrate-binding protein